MTSPADDEEKLDQDDLAAEWESMVGEDDEKGEGADTPSADAVSGRGSTRVLNQEEIDSLLGGEGADGDQDARSGIQAVLSSALVSYERLPMLEVVFDRLVRLMSTSLRNFTSDNVEVSLDNIASIRFGDYLNSISLPAMMSVFKAEEWDNFGLISVDSSLVYSIVEVLLGGGRAAPAAPVSLTWLYRYCVICIDSCVRVVYAITHYTIIRILVCCS